MKNLALRFVFILTVLTGCNTTFLLQYDEEVSIKDFEWSKRIDGVLGTYYIIQGELLHGSNYNSKYYKISLDNGNILDTLMNYKVDSERELLILDQEKTIYFNGYSDHRVDEPDDFKYQGLILKAYDRQYRGDHETYFITLKTADDIEKTIKFNRDEFDFISDILLYGNSKLIVIYNSQASGKDHPYFDHVGLLDLSKIIK